MALLWCHKKLHLASQTDCTKLVTYRNPRSLCLARFLFEYFTLDDVHWKSATQIMKVSPALFKIGF